jgi:hypothetical protein
MVIGDVAHYSPLTILRGHTVLSKVDTILTDNPTIICNLWSPDADETTMTMNSRRATDEPLRTVTVTDTAATIVFCC